MKLRIKTKKRRTSATYRRITIALAYMKQVQQNDSKCGKGHQKLSEELMVENYTNLITINP